MHVKKKIIKLQYADDIVRDHKLFSDHFQLCKNEINPRHPNSTPLRIKRFNSVLFR